MSKVHALAESRGYKIGPVIVNGGPARILIERTLASPCYPSCKGFDTAMEAGRYLESLPELPRFRFQASYEDGDSEVFEIYDTNATEAFCRAVKDASWGRPGRRIPGHTLKSVELLV